MKSIIIFIWCIWQILLLNLVITLSISQSFSKTKAESILTNDKFNKIKDIIRWPFKISHSVSKVSRYLNTSPTNSIANNSRIMFASLSSSDEKPLQTSFIISMDICKIAELCKNILPKVCFQVLPSIPQLQINLIMTRTAEVLFTIRLLKKLTSLNITLNQPTWPQ